MQALGYTLARAPHQKRNLVHHHRHIEQPSHDDAVKLLEAWDRLHSKGGMVMGQHFPTRDFASLLPNIVLFEQMPDEGEFRVRLCGFSMLCFHGQDLTGKKLSEFFPGPGYRKHFSHLSDVLRAGKPGVLHEESVHQGETIARREVVSLPVLASDCLTRLVLVVSFWADTRWRH